MQSPEVANSPASETTTDGDQSRIQQTGHSDNLLGLFKSRPLCALYIAVSLGFLLQQIPALKQFHLFGERELNQPKAAERRDNLQLSVGEATLSEESQSTEGDAFAKKSGAISARGPIAEKQTPVESNLDVDIKPPPVSLEDPSGRALNSFFAQLLETKSASRNALTRIVHFGDSVVASDYVTSTLRRRFHEQFGDGGHGFTLIANAWPAYFHEGVNRYATSGWLISRVVGPVAEDGWHGLGGVSFRAPPNLLARIGTAKKGDVGRKVSHFELAYVEAPGSGTVMIRIDGQSQPLLDTNGPVKRFRTAVYNVPDGEHEFELQTKTGTSRFFGVVLERNTAGVVLDAIGIQGARIRFLDKQDDSHFAEQLKWRTPALVVYQFGANESADGYAYPMPEFYATMRAVVEQQKKAVPEASCLILGAMDRASRKGDEIRSLSIIPLIVEQQRRVSNDLGCAFFDTFKAMGGTGSMPQWFRRGLGQSDLTHPSGAGAEVLGNWIFRALMQAARDYGSNANRVAH